MKPWVLYGGRAWLPASATMTHIPERIWPVVDVVGDEHGDAVVVDLGGVVASIDAEDIPFEEMMGGTYEWVASWEDGSVTHRHRFSGQTLRHTHEDLGVHGYYEHPEDLAADEALVAARVEQQEIDESERKLRRRP